MFILPHCVGIVKENMKSTNVSETIDCFWDVFIVDEGVIVGMALEGFVKVAAGKKDEICLNGRVGMDNALGQMVIKQVAHAAEGIGTGE